MARDSLIKIRRGAAATWTSTNPTLAAGELGYETDTGKLKIGDGSTAWNSLAYFAPGGGSGDVATDTIWNAKGDLAGGTGSDTAARLPVGTDGQILYADSGETTGLLWDDPPSGGSGDVATDPIFDAKGDLPVGTGSDTSARLAVGANGKIPVAASGETTGIKWDTGYLGGLELVYRYTVAGSDKASIDTGSDTPDAGSNDWTNGDLLEVWIIHRTDDAGATGTIDITVNNDTGNNYDRQVFSAANTTVAAAVGLAAASWNLGSHGSGGTGSRPATARLSIPGFTLTTFHKAGNFENARTDGTAGNNAVVNGAMAWANTAAITRLKVAAGGAGTPKLKVGSQLLIYKRRNA